MQILQVKLGKKLKSQGFGMIDSMVGLVLLAFLILGVLRFKHINQQNDEAIALANQTKEYVRVFSNYIVGDMDDIKGYTANGKIGVITPAKLLGLKLWPENFATKNLLQQTPCLIVGQKQDPNTGSRDGLEILMYFVGGGIDNSGNRINLINRAATLLGGDGGMYKDGKILGNSGWSFDSSSSFISAQNQCGGAINPHSLAFSLNTLSDIDTDLQPFTPIVKKELHAPANTLYGPGHELNPNTLKTTLTLVKDKGVVFLNDGPDVTQSGRVILQIQDGGQGSDTPTLGVVTDQQSNQISTLSADTIQPSTMREAGSPCTNDELGKTIADPGISGDNQQVLARNTLVCTKNEMICPNGSCYLPSIANKVIFRNTNQGLQKGDGSFTCPAAVPFAISYTAEVVAFNVKAYVFYDIYSPWAVTAKIWASFGKYQDTNHYPQMFSSKATGWDIATDFLQISSGSELIGVNLGNIDGAPIISQSYISTANIEAKPIIKSLNNFSVNTGYVISIGGNPRKCDEVCSVLNVVSGKPWQTLGNRRSERMGKRNFTTFGENLGCGCEMSEFNGDNHDYYKGIGAVLFDGAQPMITSATCSNMPEYVTNAP